MPKVSIILPTYNGSKWISGAINSVITQSFSDWELIIVDDGSVDNTAEIVKKFSGKDARIKYFKNTENLRTAKAINRGLKEASGEFIARIDEDDKWICPDKLEKQVRFLDENKEYVLVGMGIIMIDEAGNELGRYSYPTDDQEIRNQFLARCCFASSSVIFRKKPALDCGGYNGSLEVRSAEDYDFWLKLGAYGKFTNIDEYCVKYMMRDRSVSSNKLVQAKKGIFLAKKYKNQYPNYTPIIINRYISLIKYFLLNLVPFSFRKSAIALKFKINKFLQEKARG